MAKETNPIENQEETPIRDRLLNRAKSRYPDRSFDTDDDLYGAIGEELEETDGRMKGYEENERKLLDLFNSSDARGVEVFQRWRNGENPVSVIIELFGDDAVDFIKEPANKDKFDAAYAKWAERQAKEAAMAAKEEENGAASLDNLKRVSEAGKFTPEQMQSAFDLILRVSEEALGGIISEDTWRIAFNALNHDRDVAAARDEGNVAGRNANIQEKLRKPATPSVPMMGSRGGAGTMTPMPLGGKPQQGGSAWDRGKRK